MKTWLAVLVILLAGVFLMSEVAPLRVDLTHPISPVVTVRTAVAADKQKKFFERLQAFSGANGFRMDISQNPHFKESYDVNLTRKDVWVLGDSLFEPSVFTLQFYPAPGLTVSAAEVEPLVDDLARRISEGGDFSASVGH